MCVAWGVGDERPSADELLAAVLDAHVGSGSPGGSGSHDPIATASTPGPDGADDTAPLGST